MTRHLEDGDLVHLYLFDVWGAIKEFRPGVVLAFPRMDDYGDFRDLTFQVLDRGGSVYAALAPEDWAYLRSRGLLMFPSPTESWSGEPRGRTGVVGAANSVSVAPGGVIQRASLLFRGRGGLSGTGAGGAARVLMASSGLVARASLVSHPCSPG